MVNYTKPLNQKKRCVIEKLLSTSSIENGSIDISNDDWNSVLGP